MMGFPSEFGDITVSGVGGVGATKDTFSQFKERKEKKETWWWSSKIKVPMFVLLKTASKVKNCSLQLLFFFSFSFIISFYSCDASCGILTWARRFILIMMKHILTFNLKNCILASVINTEVVNLSTDSTSWTQYRHTLTIIVAWH